MPVPGEHLWRITFATALMVPVVAAIPAEGVVGLTLAIAAGVAVQLLRGPLSSTHGYAAAFLVACAAVLVSIPLTRRLGGR